MSFLISTSRTRHLTAIIIAAILVNMSLSAVKDHLTRYSTVSARRNHAKRWHDYVGFCGRKEVPAFPFSSDLIRIYFVETQHAKPGVELAALEAVRAATASLWHGLPGHAEASLEEVPRLVEFIRNSRRVEYKIPSAASSFLPALLQLTTRRDQGSKTSPEVAHRKLTVATPSMVTL